MAELQADFELLPRETLEANMELVPRDEIEATFEINIATKGDTGNGIESIEKTGTSGLVDTYTIQYTDGDSTTFNVTNGAKGDTGPAGADAKINGVNTLTLTTSYGLTLTQSGNNANISGKEITDVVDGISALIPAQASEQNQLADKQYVLNSIPTIEDLTTTAQQNALNSGITSANVTQITTNKNNIAGEITNRQNADNNLQQQIDAITASSDVKDIVGTYAELEAYDTSTLGNNDIIKVLQDETQDNETTYYRWSTSTHTFTLIGAEGPYYTKSEANTTFVPQTRTVNGKALSGNITLSASDVNALPSSTVIPTVNDATLTVTLNGTAAGTFSANASSNVTIPLTDTTYSNFVGTDGVDSGSSGLVPAPTSSDYSYVLRATGSWGAIDYSEITNTPTIPTSSDYWTITTDQTSSGKKMINYTQANAQDNGFRVISKSDSSSVGTVGAWTARVLIGNEKRTFLMGTARNSASTSQSICGIGAHTWGSATSQTSAQWDNVYFQPDGSTGCYLGGNGWRGSSGWLRVLNNNSGNAGYRTSINTGTAASPTWRTVLPNQSSGTGSVYFINAPGSWYSYNYAISIGGAVTSDYGTSVGYNSTAAGHAVALGSSATASGSYSIQLGYGTNSTANTMYVGLSSSLNVQLLDSTGVIPAGRLNIASSVDSTSTNSQMVGAKLFYDTVGDIETLLQNINSGS